MKEEIEKEWIDLTEGETFMCLAAHTQAVNLNWKNARHMATMRRIFDLGSPKIVFGYKDGEMNYCRIHENSADVIKILIRQYL